MSAINDLWETSIENGSSNEQAMVEQQYTGRPQQPIETNREQVMKSNDHGFREIGYPKLANDL